MLNVNSSKYAKWKFQAARWFEIWNQLAVPPALAFVGLPPVTSFLVSVLYPEAGPDRVLEVVASDILRWWTVYVIAAVVWAVLCIPIACWRFRTAFRDLGELSGDTFIYRDPKVVVLMHLTNPSSEYKRSFKLNGLPAFALVEWSTEMRGSTLWEANVTFGQDAPVQMMVGGKAGSHTAKHILSPNKQMWLVAKATRPDAAESYVRVLIHSIKFQPRPRPTPETESP
jgi:hypothetical protein